MSYYYIVVMLFPCGVQKSSFHRAQTLGYKNGYAVPRRPSAGVGQDPLLSANISQSERNQLISDIPNLTYGTDSQRHPPLNFIPAHAAYDKKVKMSVCLYVSLYICLYVLHHQQ